MADRANGMEPANGVQRLLTGQIGPVEFHICTCYEITADMLCAECMNKTHTHTRVKGVGMKAEIKSDAKQADSSFLFSMTH